MLEQILRLFWPAKDPAAQVILLVLFVLVGLWTVLLLRAWASVSRERTRARRLSEVTGLSDRVAEQQEASVDSFIDQGSLYDGFLSSRRVPESSPIARHVRTIFAAGWYGSRLDVGQLLNATKSVLFRHNSLLKGWLGMFIIVGLFGTLVALSSSLSRLSGLATATVSDDARRLLGELLPSLSAAFAPSLWGVGLTVLGVVAYSIYIRYACQTLSQYLDQLTLDVWIPNLYPTTPQRTMEALARADLQVHESLKSASKVAEFAEGLETELANFTPRIESANNFLATFGLALQSAEAWTSKFTASIEDSESLRSQLKSAVTSASGTFSAMNNVLNKIALQNEELSVGLTGLRTFERTYLAGQKKRDDQISGMTSSAIEAFDSLKTRNEEVVNALARPLERRLGAIEESLTSQLNAIDKSLSELQSPIDAAAEKLKDMAENQVKGHEVIQEKVHKRLKEDVSDPLGTKLAAIDSTVSQRLGEVESGIRSLQNPVKQSADHIEGIAQSFTKSVSLLLGQLHSDFDSQSDSTKQLAQKVDALTQQLEGLVRTQEQLLREAELVRSQRRRRSSNGSGTATNNGKDGLLERLKGLFRSSNPKRKR